LWRRDIVAAMYATAASASARLVSLRAQLVWVACLLAGVAIAGSADLTVVAATLVVTALLTLHVAASLHVEPARRTQDATLRERARRTRVARLCDPDAAGRPRPRAPSA